MDRIALAKQLVVLAKELSETPENERGSLPLSFDSKWDAYFVPKDRKDILYTSFKDAIKSMMGNVPMEDTWHGKTADGVIDHAADQCTSLVSEILRDWANGEDYTDQVFNKRR